MRQWIVILGGLAIWAAHFLAIYVVASAFPGQDLARYLVVAASLAAIGANVGVLIAIRRMRTADALDRWIADLGQIGAALSILAVVWQSVPALIA